MNRLFILSVLFLALVSCSASKGGNKNNRCPTIYKNSFTEILFEKYKTVYENDTTEFHEIRYECVYSSFYSKKVMYDKFGHWDSAIFPSNSRHPLLLWEGIDILADGNKYDIITTGVEEWRHIYASFIVLDDKGNDVLKDSSLTKTKLVKVFGEMIKSNDQEKNEFYDIYWSIVKNTP